MCGAGKSMANVCVSESMARLIGKFSPKGSQYSLEEGPETWLSE